MIKLQTQVAETPCKVSISYGDKILLLGSCFSDSIGKTMLDYGFDALVNPFGTLYNPASIREAISRLATGKEFTESDCVPMGSGAGKICSFSHHTSFARDDKAAFLENANSVLRSASAFFRNCNKIIITLGTAWCYRYVGPAKKWEGSPCEGNGLPYEGNGSANDWKKPVCDSKGSDCDGVTSIDPSNEGKIVSNCLKRDGKEFLRHRLTFAECTAILNDIISLCGGSDHGQNIIFTVSPIRHLTDGAHDNQLSKSTLLLSIDEVINHTLSTLPNETDSNPSVDCDYFPAYEIMMDELRDYRFYAEDMVHPSAQAISHITDRFLSRHLVPSDTALLEARILAHKHSLHRPNLL